MYPSAPLSKRTRAFAIATAAAFTIALVPAGAAAAAPAAKCDNRNNNTVAKLLECVDADGATEHLEAFQAIADENDGNRAAGLPGYEASVDYVVGVLEDAGWDVTIDEFDYTFIGASTLSQLTPVAAEYPTGAFSGSGSGDVTGAVVPVDINLVGDRASSSGCEAADFAGFPAGSIALVQRGTCNFGDKAYFAGQAGATAVIIFNQGNTPDREGLVVADASSRTDGSPVSHDIPVVGASFQQGVALAQAGSTANVFVPAPEQRPQKNVIAEKTGVNDDNVVMAGAHLDSVPEGPGINDNGSGSAALLELAQNLEKLKPQNTIRLAWWGAEEDGLLGSAAYVEELSQAERDRIALYLNFDMVASPNYIFMAYDGDESGWPAPVTVPEGSVQIEDLFESYYTSVGEPYDDAEFSGRSDYEAFILNGIPAGGLFTGAEVVKTAEQAAIWGGIAGESYDQCYHQACDTIDNIDEHAFDVNVDAIALAVLAYAYSTESVNGVAGVPVPGGLALPAPAGPEGTVNLPGGGGLSPDHGHSHGEDH
ncbi:M20/M25/M40 family metallo-hydrolase [Agromyces sp. CFH 90414]|uniref:M20/M25/M40 family metallo-hydrolase n=1 Tax=Agromyces agglutinans TaxID=2662258 RepID=A0A6I2F9Q0_9MICO|nr:M28 family metallopeptidase [Agromyces agglutinans]MRG61369.1 M20/M25/M40 family metallo-hydrolase [Agromyces agglutinans]